MSIELARRQDQILQIRGSVSLPSLIVNAGDNAAEKFIDFFTAQIRNRNTREAYARAVGNLWRGARNEASN
jgi:integrase/recombinase XerD